MPINTASLRSAILEQPSTTAALLCLAHMLLWGLMALIGFQVLPIDLLEGFVWGRVPDYGFNKHPPLFGWVIGAWEHFAPNLPRATLIIGQLFVGATLALLYLFGRALFGGAAALLAVALIEGMFYLTIYPVHFNVDVVAMPFIVLIAWTAWRAITHDRLQDWLLAGLAAGAALYTKYTVLLTLLAVLVFMLMQPRTRALLASPRPYLGGLAALWIALPHLTWLGQSGFLPFQYGIERPAAPGISGALLAFGNFFGNQLGYHIGLAILVALAIWPKDRAQPVAPLYVTRDDSPDARRYLLCLALVPFGLSLILQAVSGVQFRALWGATLFLFSGLAVIAVTPREMVIRNLDALFITLATLMVAFPLLLALSGFINMGSWPTWRNVYPAERLAKTLTLEFQTVTGKAPNLVIGDVWMGGIVSVYGSPTAHLLIDGDPAKNPRVAIDRIAREGALIVWEEPPLGAGDRLPAALTAPRDPNAPASLALKAFLATAQIMPYKDFAWTRGTATPYLRVGWAIIPPQKAAP